MVRSPTDHYSYCDFQSSWDKKAEWQYRKGGLAFAKALIGKRKRVWGVGETLIGVRKRVANCESAFWKSQQNAQNARKTRKITETRSQKSKSYHPQSVPHCALVAPAQLTEPQSFC